MAGRLVSFGHSRCRGVLLAAAFLLGCVSPRPEPFAPTKLFVRFHPHVTAEARQFLLDDVDARLVSTSALVSDLVVLAVPLPEAEAVGYFKSLPEVRYAHPDRAMTPAAQNSNPTP